MTKKWSFAIVTMLLALAICAFTQVREVKVTYGPSVQSLTDTTAFITWSTNVSANSLLRYGTTPKALDQVAQSPSGGTTHSVHLKDLRPDTTYYYRVSTSAPQSSEPMSAPASFKTK